ncbi:chemotaxis protein CheW [Desulfovibrio inopinatus]|uniref:chemotaxis protein CheW n=1 Tax=Desulfovibrio inopinatus TaxID=102109 RepID=UPI0003FF2562|nr:chemotaxis protein CheW [Desulfovibrio inopinatus]
MKEQQNLELSRPNESAVLNARANKLAQEHAPPTQPSGHTLSILEVGIGKERYGIETNYIKEVHSVAGLTPIPCTPDFILGVVSIRGRVCSVMDVRRLFGIPSGLLTDADRIVLLQHNDMETSILASSVGMVNSIQTDILSPWKPPGDASMVRFVRGLSPDGLLVLSTETLLTDEYILINDEVVL